MFRQLDSLIPSFLKKLDRKILLNRPGLWATKIHYVVILGAMGFGSMYFYGLVKPINLTSVPSPMTSFVLALIPAILGFLLWVYRISFFQVDKGFGQSSANDSVRNMGIYALVIGLLATAPVLYSQLIKTQLQKSVPLEVLIEDINTLNLGESLFVTDSYDYENSYRSRSSLYNDHSDDFRYLRYNRYPVYSDYHHALGLWEHHEVVEQLVTYESYSDKLELITRFKTVFNKYSPTPIVLSSQKILNNYENETWGFDQTRYDNAKEKIAENLSILQKSHLENEGVFSGRNDIMVYILMLTMLWMALQAFLKTNWKLFGGAILAAVVTGISTGVLMVITDYIFSGVTDQTLLLIITAFFFIYLYQGFRKKHTNRTKIWKSVALNLVAVATPIMPLVIASSFSSHFNYNEEQALIYFGVLFAVLAWGLMYGPQFTKLSAQPKEN